MPRRKKKRREFPTTMIKAMDGRGIKRIKRLEKKGRGPDIPTGARLALVGLTQEQALIRYTPADATIPERMVYGWLIKNDFIFTYQAIALGGRVPGGAVIDFVIHSTNPPMAIRVQGHYWHSNAAQSFIDEIQKEALEHLGYNVIDIWDYEVNTAARTNTTMLQVFFGLKNNIGMTTNTAMALVGSEVIDVQDAQNIESAVLW